MKVKLAIQLTTFCRVFTSLVFFSFLEFKKLFYRGCEFTQQNPAPDSVEDKEEIVIIDATIDISACPAFNLI